MLFYKSYNIETEKGFFPYEWFDSFEKLKHTSLPPQEEWYSTLKNETIKPEDYAKMLKVWEEKI